MNALRCVALLSLLVSAPAFAQQAPRPAAPPKPAAQGALAPRQDKVFDIGVTWMAVSLNGKAFPGPDRPSFSIDKQFRARGFGGCNTFAATAFTLREQRLAVSPLTWTKKKCAAPVMASEMAFFQAIRYAVQWDQQGSTLIIKSQNGELRFERAI